MNTIHKYPIKITDRQEVTLPENAKIIHVGIDPRGLPCLWAEVDTFDYECSDRDIYVVGTGNPRDEEAKTHLGSFVQGPFVWHVYTN